MNEQQEHQASSLGSRLVASVGSLLGLGDRKKRKAQDENDESSSNKRRVVLARLDHIMPSFHAQQPPIIVPSGYCAICLDTVLNPHDRVGTLAGCGHCFHVDCYQNWERLVVPNTHTHCPLCEDDSQQRFQSIVLFPADSDDQQFFNTTFSQSLGSVIIKLVETIRYSSEPMLVNKALEELIDLACSDRKTRIPICNAGGIPGILRCMQVFTLSVQTNACQLLGNLALSDGHTERIEMAIVQAGGIQAILSVMKLYPNEREIQELACFCLGKIICESTRDVAGQIQALLDAMQNHSDAALMQTYACYALSNLTARNEHEKVVHRIVDMGGIEATLKAIQVHYQDEDVMDAALSVLMTLIDKNVQHCKVLMSLHPMDSMVKAMLSHMDNPEVQACAMCILANIVHIQDESNLIAIANAGGVNAILRAMSEHKGHSELERHGVEILSQLAKIQRIRPILQNSGLEAIRAAMKLYSNDKQLVEWGQIILESVKEEGS